MSNMQGKTLVITGATKGIGKAVAEKFAQNGVNIAFTYNSNKEAADEISADLTEKYGVKVVYDSNGTLAQHIYPLYINCRYLI